MATRSIAWRNWRLSRRATRGAGDLRFIDPPPQPQVHTRDVQAALEFVGTPTAATTPADVNWYHTIELPDGFVTPGRFDHRPLVPSYGLPARLDGQRALDVATFDGFWAFELERRGAQVVAIDVDSTRDVDFPTLVRAAVDTMADMPVIGDGFRVAHDALGSSVERIGCSVYDLAPEKVGTFDFVHCGDLLLHLRDPLTALERMRSVCTGTFLLSDAIDLDAPAGGPGPTIRYLGGWADVVWWLPSLDALAQLVVDAGFRDVRVNAVYQLGKTSNEAGLWRASLTADGTDGPR
jgi:tRNA (mo5U34)-methyltransferase